MITIHPIETIVSDSEVRFGHPIIMGTQIRLVDVVASHLYRGLSAEELAINFALDLGQVYAALAYYYQHKPEINARMQADEEESERLLEHFIAEGKLIHLD